MISEINQTPKALRLHIGIFGRTNAGKSTLINALSGQNIALTSPVAGTTTDPVFKPMELLPLGPVVFIDTAGFDDDTDLGKMRIKKTIEQISACDLAVLVVSSDTEDLSYEERYIDLFNKRNIPFILVINVVNEKYNHINAISKYDPIYIDFFKDSILPLKLSIISKLNNNEKEPELTGNLVKNGDTVLLVMPQDIQAPKGRLILPEVQTIRDLLDNKCIVVSVTEDNIIPALNNMTKKPDLVITDSQIFKNVDKVIPSDIRLTSFSVIIAKIKGDINGFITSAEQIDKLNDGDFVAIIESCSHHPLDNDIAREQLPKLLKKHTNKDLDIRIFSGNIEKSQLENCKLAIHCGGCMLNRKAMISKQNLFNSMNIPLTNFGISIAYMNGILKRICF